MKRIVLLSALLAALQMGVAPAFIQAQDMPVQLVASTVNEDQDFGYSVALDNDLAVVGAFRDDEGFMVETGAAFVYRFNGTAWIEETKLQASSMQSFNWFGWDVALSGDALLASTRHGDTFLMNGGDVPVFRHNGNTWVEESILTPSDAVQGDFGFAVEIDGDVAAVGAPARAGTVANEGAVYVYRHNGSQWIEEDLLLGSDLSIQSLFGSDISIDGDRMLVSAFNADDSTSTQAGKLYVFDYDGSLWHETAVLQSDHSNNIANLGVSVSLEGDWAVGGAPLDNEIAGGAGAAFVYRFDGANWNFHSKLTASDGVGFFLFGSSVSLSGDRLLVTADNWGTPGGGATGKAYLFEYDDINDIWEEVDGFVPAAADVGGSFGHAARMQGEVMIIGAPGYSGTHGDMGTAFIYGEPSVATANEVELPQAAFEISAPFPNPFSEKATLKIMAHDEHPVRIVMSDILGRDIETIFEGRLPAGTPISIPIEASDLPGGIYWIRVVSRTATSTHPITLVK